jgi:hypothetical protein
MDSQIPSSQKSIEEKIAEMRGVPTRDTLLENLKTDVYVVTFEKLDGDERVMTCTLVPEHLPKASKDEPLSQEKIRKISDKVCAVWDINAQGWRSFRYDRLRKVEKYKK